MKKICLLLVLVLVSGLLPTALAGAAEDVKTYVLGVTDSPTIEDWNTNLQTLHIEETLGVNLEFVLLPNTVSERNQKLELMILAGGADLPEVLVDMDMGGLSSLELYGNMGMILPMNELYNNSPHLDASLAAFVEPPMTKEEFMKYLTCSDGNIYTLGKCFVSMLNFFAGSRINIYEPWLEALGLDVPQTTEEFLTVMRAFRDEDPNGNGLADEIPLMGYSGTVNSNMIRAFMNPFVYTQENFLINDNGVITFAANQEGWKEGLKYVYQLFDEGLLSTLSLTQDVTQFTAMLCTEETTAGAILMNSSSRMPASDPRRAEYVLVGALEGPTGLRQLPRMDTLPGVAYVITKNCQDPEGAFAIGDYLSGMEMSIWTRYGREGYEWEWLEEPEESLYASLGYKGEVRVLNTTWASLQNTFWEQRGPNVLENSNFGYRLAIETNPGVYSNLEPQARTVARELDWGNTENRVHGLIFNAEEQEVITEYRATINDYVHETFAQFVTGAVDIDAGWDAYLSEFPKMGLDTYLAAVQSCWDRMNAN